MRDSASRRDWRVSALGVKVKRVRVKRAGAVSSLHSEDVRRIEQIVATSMCERRLDRTPSFRQRRRNVGLAKAITCACRGRDELGCAAETEKRPQLKDKCYEKTVMNIDETGSRC